MKDDGQRYLCRAITEDAALKGTATKTGKAVIALARLQEFRLPVAASAAASATAAAAIAATTAAVAATSTAASPAAAASSAATAPAAFALWAGFVHYYLAAFEIFPV